MRTGNLGNVGRRGLEWDEDSMNLIEYLAGRGLTQKQVAAYFGISHSSLARHFNQNDELRMRFYKGKSKAIVEMSGNLFQQSQDGSTPATIFYLKTQAGWKEPEFNVATESDFYDTTDVEPVAELKIMTQNPNEAAKIYQQIMLGERHNE